MGKDQGFGGGGSGKLVELWKTPTTRLIATTVRFSLLLFDLLLLYFSLILTEEVLP